MNRKWSKIFCKMVLQGQTKVLQLTRLQNGPTRLENGPTRINNNTGYRTTRLENCPTRLENGPTKLEKVYKAKRFEKWSYKVGNMFYKVQ